MRPSATVYGTQFNLKGDWINVVGAIQPNAGTVIEARRSHAQFRGSTVVLNPLVSISTAP